MTAYYGQSHIEVTFAGVTLPGVYAAQARHSALQRVAEARVVLPAVPSTGTYNDAVTIVGGRTSANRTATRFTGYLRDYDYDLFPNMVTLYFKGELVKAEEYQNPDDPSGLGGLSLRDLLGVDHAADEAIVKAVLDVCSVTYTSGDIGGTGRPMGNNNPTEWIWQAGTPNDPTRPQLFREKGQAGMDYISDVDYISAEYDSGTGEGGFYFTFDGISTPKRLRMGGRPSGTPDLTFTEGIDILRGSRISRKFPIANAVLVKGFDPGTGTGNVEDFLQSSNSFMPSSRPILDSYSSPLIEFATEADAAAYGAALGLSGAEGMSCEIIKQARELDVNREIVQGYINTYIDDVIEPGQAHLVQGPGGTAARLGTGEQVWCVANTMTWEHRGSVLVFRQRPEYIGGGIT